MQFDKEGRVTESGLAHLKEAVNAPQNPVKYLGIDPGKKNGICGYDAKFYLVFSYTVHMDDVGIFLDQFECLDTVVMEKFKLYPNKAKVQIYSEMETSKVIGKVEDYCRRTEVKLVQQMATIKDTAYMWLGKKKPSKSDPLNHQKDANAHFMYWAIKNKHFDVGKLLTDE